MGYVKAQSPMSLYVGVTAGVLAVIAGVMAGKNPGFGFRLAGMVSLAMTLFWSWRLIKVLGEGKSPMVAIPALVLSAAVFLILTISHFRAVAQRQGSA